MRANFFPDLNVWLALSLRAHEHHQIAWRWYRALANHEELVFCRVTQMSLLRMLTNEAVAKKETKTQRQAWAVYDHWINDGGAVFQDEPFELESEFRRFADRDVPGHREWTDSYLAAFAAATSIELITFDKALSMRARRSVLLGSKG